MASYLLFITAGDIPPSLFERVKQILLDVKFSVKIFSNDARLFELPDGIFEFEANFDIYHTRKLVETALQKANANCRFILAETNELTWSLPEMA